jgi:hypothetical protein
MLIKFKEQIQLQMKRLLILYGVLMLLRPINHILGLYLYIGLDSITIGFFLLQLCKWVFYLFLLKMKIISYVLEKGGENEARSERGS